MTSKALNLMLLLIVSTVYVAAAGAQQNQAQQNQPAPPQPAQSPAAAQSAATQDGRGANSSAATAPTPAKKVWTNEDLSGLRDRSAISTFGSKDASGGGAAKASAPASGRDANSYRRQIVQLQEQIPPLDRKIAGLHSAIEGNTTNDPNTSSRPYRGVKPGSWQAEMEQSETKRANILARIDALRDQARHAGVAPSALP